MLVSLTFNLLENLAWFVFLFIPLLFSDSKVSEDSIVSGPVLQPDDQNIEMDRRARVSGRWNVCLVLFINPMTFGCS